VREGGFVGKVEEMEQATSFLHNNGTVHLVGYNV